MGEIFYPPKSAPEPGGANVPAPAKDETGGAAPHADSAPKKPAEPQAPPAPQATDTGANHSSAMGGRVFRQSLLTALFLVGGGLAVWHFAVAPALDRRSADLEAQLQESRRQLREVTAQMEADKARLNQEAGRAALTGEVARQSAELEALNARTESLTRTNETLIQANSALTAKNTELSEAIDKLNEQRMALSEQIEELDRRNAALQSRSKRLDEEAARLAARVDDKRGAVAGIGTDLKRLAADLEAERRKLQELTASIETARSAYISGLTALANEYARVANRSYGESRTRYTVLADKVRERLDAIGEQRVVIDLGSDISAKFAGRVDAYVTTSLLRGKSATILYGDGRRDLAERLRGALAGFGVAVSSKSSDALTGAANSVAFAGAGNRLAAERVRDLVATGFGLSADLAPADDSLADDIVIRLIGGPLPTKDEPRVKKTGDEPAETGKAPQSPKPDAG